jgi:hypothetical protein
MVPTGTNLPLLYEFFRITALWAVVFCCLIILAPFGRGDYFSRKAVSREEYELCISISVSLTVHYMLQGHLM